MLIRSDFKIHPRLNMQKGAIIRPWKTNRLNICSSIQLFIEHLYMQGTVGQLRLMLAVGNRMDLKTMLPRLLSYLTKSLLIAEFVLIEEFSRT